MLPAPTTNITTISDQQQPTQKMPWRMPRRRLSRRASTPVQFSTMNDIGERQRSRHSYFIRLNW